MTNTRLVALFASLQVAIVPSAFAASGHVRPAGAEVRVVRPPMPAAQAKPGFVLRQDLFDRADPNNVKTNWPAPPAQPGQF
jgi:hypothetical protein